MLKNQPQLRVRIYREGYPLLQQSRRYPGKASQELDDDKYAELVKQFEASLKACIEPFEKAYEISKDENIKGSVAEYLKNACFRFRTEGEEYQAKYEKYAAAVK